MSANNVLLISKHKKTWQVWDKDIEDVWGNKIGEAKTLEKAVRLANEYQETIVVEYGLQIVLDEK